MLFSGVLGACGDVWYPTRSIRAESDIEIFGNEQNNPSFVGLHAQFKGEEMVSKNY